MDFEEIRPYNDDEVKLKIKALLEEEQFREVMKQVNPDVPFEMFEQKMLSINTVREFQAGIIVPILDKLIQKTTDGISVDGLENLDTSENYLFVSTHRDIVLDSALMNFILLREGHETAEIAIGDNLMKIPWVVDLVKLNKTFIVKRNVPKEQKVEASMQLSSYINYTIKEKGNSIWIAQRSGRSKDGNDETNPSLLKMFSLGATEDSAFEKLKSLKICPISVAYEYNPCDGLTLPELISVAKGEKYEKQPMEDMMHMAEGIQGRKGKISVSFGKPINPLMEEYSSIKNRNDFFAQVADLIDQQIHTSYHLMPTNYIAYDLLKGQDKFSNEYTAEQKQEFINHMEKRLRAFEGEEALAKETFLKMYGNPVVNKIKDDQ